MTQILDRSGSTALPVARRRRRLMVSVVGCAVLLLATATALALRTRDPDSRRTYLSTNGWPEHGQGAYQVGGGQPAASPHQHPVPIASLAKVMTALVVLEHLPLGGTADGPTLLVREEDVIDTARRANRDESVVPVRAGERLSERQALMALLLPSANNVAVMLARYVSGTVDMFVSEMNAMAKSLGLTHTTYTDPSGFDPATVSTAADQLTLARHAADDRTLTAMMSTASYPLPVAGTVSNTDALLGKDGFVGMKTGSDDAAGGCFMFRSYRSVHGVTTELIRRGTGPARAQPDQRGAVRRPAACRPHSAGARAGDLLALRQRVAVDPGEVRENPAAVRLDREAAGRTTSPGRHRGRPRVRPAQRAAEGCPRTSATEVTGRSGKRSRSGAESNAWSAASMASDARA